MLPANHASDDADDVSLGRAALNRADWAAARAAFERALAVTPTPEAHDGLGIALWWLNEIDAAHRQRARAYVGFKERGQPGRAAQIAGWLAREQLFLDGNVPAMQGWFVRAEQSLRLVEPGLERAWLGLLRASVTAPPPDVAAAAAVALDVARSAGDRDLEAMALAFQGQALATLGQVGEGMAGLDEAMTMATGGEVADLMIISEIFCVMLSTCELAGDLARSELWCRRADDFSRQYSCPFLSAYCRTAYGGLMTALGRWAEADAALVEAIQAFEHGHRGLKPHAVIKLADLRVYQGKIEEAELLLIGLEDRRAAVVPLARLYMEKGELVQARAILEQALPEASAATLDQLPAYLLWVEVALAAGDAAALRRVTGQLAGMAERARSDLFTAQIEFTLGCVSYQTGDFDDARQRFNAALARLQAYEQSLLAGRVRLQMARVLQADDPAGAVAWARGALATFERIGAEHEAANAAALLRQLGAGRAASAHSPALLTRREAEIAALIALGLSNRDVAQRLVISPKTVEHHVSRILDKLNLRNRSEVAALAARGLLHEEP